MTDEPGDKLVRSAATYLARWAGASARVRFHGPSLGHVEIVLERDADDQSKNLAVSFAPTRWHGPFEWQDARLVVSQVRHDPAAFEISDEAADFRCQTDWLEVKENVRL